jgi:hypothetical protein
MAVETDDLPLLPADATPARPSLAEQQRSHAAEQQPSDDSLPIAPPAAPPLLNSSWSVAGKQLYDAGARGAGLATRDVLTGGTSLPIAALDVATWPVRAFQRAIGIPTAAPSTLRGKLLDAAGLPTPETDTEKNISTFTQGASAALAGGAGGAVTGATSMAPTIANATRLLLQGGTGAVAGKKASESDLVPWWLKPTVDLGFNVLGAKGADVGFNLGAKATNAATGNMSPIYDAFVRSRVDPTLVGTVAGGEAGQSAEAALSRVPFASSVMRPVQQRTVDQFGNSVERTASQLDPAGLGATAQTTGEHLQAAARDWRNNTFPAQQNAAWTPVNQRMAGTTVDAAPYRAALEDAASPPNLASLPETQRAFASAQAKKWLDALNADVGPGGTLTWEQAQAIKQRIGDAMGTPEIVGSLGDQAMRRMYGGLADGMRTTAVQNGQGGAFDAANAVTTKGHAFIENTLNKIVKSNNPLQETVTPEQATNNILNGGDTTMQAVRDQLPGAADTTAAFKLRQAATAKPSAATQYDDTSTGTFLSNMNRMRQNQPGGYGALYNDPSVQQQLEDLSTVAGRLRATERHLNTSGTAEQLGWMEYIRNIAEHAGKGEYGKAIGAAVIPPVIGAGGARVMTSPLATRFAAAQGAGPPAMLPRTAGLLGDIAGLTGQ